MAIHDYSITGASVAPLIAQQAKQFIELNREAHGNNAPNGRSNVGRRLAQLSYAVILRTRVSY